MNKSYCGKDCMACLRREELNCPGCRPESGISFCRDCEIAKCCRSKGHETCDTCSMKDAYCSVIRKKDEYPARQERENRLEEEKQLKQQREAARRLEIARDAGKWMGFLFIISIVSTAIGMLTSLFGMDGAGDIIDIVSSLFYYGTLFVMAKYDEKYKTAALCGMVAIISGPLSGESGFMGILGLILSIAAIYGEYQELKAHADIIGRFDGTIYRAWEKWAERYLYCLGGMVVAIVSMFLIPTIGALMLLVVSLVLLAFAFAKIWYLYKSEQVLKEYIKYNSK